MKIGRVTIGKDHKLENSGLPYLKRSCQEGDCSKRQEDTKINVFTGGSSQGHPLCKCGMYGPHAFTPSDRERWFKLHSMSPEKVFTAHEIRGKSFGDTGKSLTMGQATQKFGSGNVRAGVIGEKALERMMKNDPSVGIFDRWKSLGIPYKPGQKRYISDVDFVLASGNRIILVDCKMWQAGKFYWTLLGTPMKGLAPMKSEGSEKKLMSQNMDLAVTRYREALPGHIVHGIVVFVPTPGGLPTGVKLLKWPGGISSYLPSSGLKKIRSFLGGKEDVTRKAQGVLGMMTK